MTPGQVLFELSGEHPTLPAAEALACLRAESPGSRQLKCGPGYVVIECALDALPFAARRLGLAHRFGRYLGSCEVGDLMTAISGLDLPEGSVCVRARTVDGLHPEVDTHELAKKIGGCLSLKHDIDLTVPDVTLRVLISEKAHLYIMDHEIDRRPFDRRKVAERPFFSPISLHPRYARALINLTEAKRGDTVLDPFCGTGGIVLEASLLGMRAVGSDIDPDMVAGCRLNLEHFGVEAEVLVADVGDVPDLFGKVGSVATDPPYGRAASTKKEDIEGLYRRGLRASADVLSCQGRAGVVLPREMTAEGMVLQELHMQRVHRSLTRHYHIFTRR
ncbi:MAG: methyltransferase domain-containing protein [Euryarchaeota archaeon]|nr:methyltransferase domain-containing protein [Euryarchaeota archaeon]